MNEAVNSRRSGQGAALVLAGGIALGAFEGGAYEAFAKAGLTASLRWVAGSSIGAVTAVIIAGNSPQERVTRLRQFWDTASFDRRRSCRSGTASQKKEFGGRSTIRQACCRR